MSIAMDLAARQGVAYQAVPVSETTLEQVTELVSRKREFLRAQNEIIEMVVSVHGFLRDARGMFEIRFDTIWGALQIHATWKPEKCWDFPSCWFVETQGKIVAAYSDSWEKLLGGWVLERIVEAAYANVTGTPKLVKPMFHTPEIDPFTHPSGW